jgi:serine/threonine-protein kinase
MAAALQANAPRIVGRYVLYGEIASGGMATVHFGRLVGPAGFARPVAIKRLHAQFARDPDFVKMFLDEARLAARITHPNVVSTLDVVAEDDEVFLVMEYVRGASLGQLVRTMRKRGARVPPLVGAGIVSGVLQGLHAAHEAKNDRGERLDMVHRDVSPQNILVGTDGVARLLDFGVAKASGRLQTTRDGQLKGKLAYMAPEQVRGDPLTRRTDVYAASVVLWEALTGKRLFYAENEASVLARVLCAEVPEPSSIVAELPVTFDRVVLRGLERDPAKRYSTAREMAVDLDACLGMASPTEIGEWVEATAADELRERASHIAEIERSASEAVDQDRLAASRDGVGASTGVARRSPEIQSLVWGRTTPRDDLAPPSARTQPDVSQVSSLSLAHATVPSGKGRTHKVVSTLLISASALVLLLGLVVFSQTRAVGSLSPATRSVDPTAKSGLAPPGNQPVIVHGAPPPAAATSSVPASSASATAPPSAPRAPAPPPPARAQPWRATPPAVTSVPAPAPASVSAPGECNPPYTADAKGHIHFKPNCL